MEILPTELILLIASLDATAYNCISRLSRHHNGITRRLRDPKSHFSRYISEPFAEYLTLPNGDRHGAFASYYDPAKTRTRDIRYYNTGIPEGDFVEFDDTGMVVIRGSYLRGLYHGKFTQYRPDGTICCIVNYHNGILEGPQTHYYNNGRVHNYYVIRQNRYTVYQEYLPDGTLNHQFNG